jgi:hypothetical protein
MLYGNFYSSWSSVGAQMISGINIDPTVVVEILARIVVTVAVTGALLGSVGTVFVMAWGAFAAQKNLDKSC